MASSASIEILDLRHFTSPMLRSVLEAEGELWKKRLDWDYRSSTRLLMQYLDSHMLPGYAALEAEQVIGYAFCVYEESKAVIGDVFAMPSGVRDGSGSTNEPHSSIEFEIGSETGSNESEIAGRFGSPLAIEETLLTHLLETLLNSPQVDRIESQLLLHPSGSHSGLFRQSGFRIFRRLFMVHSLNGMWNTPRPDLPSNLEIRPWRDEDLAPAARLISEAYRGHTDSLINDQYRSIHGSSRFLNNIVRYAGCGTFSQQASHVITERKSRELVAMVLGSRVSPHSGHITQICVHPEYRRRGLARALLSTAAFCFLRQGATEISLTVTEANAQAIELYRAEGYVCKHVFDAAVWQRGVA